MGLFENKRKILIIIISFVILILAILLFSFVHNITTGSSSKLVAMNDGEDLLIDSATKEQPIIFDSAFQLRAGKPKVMKMSVYNSNSFDLYDSFPNITSDCMGGNIILKAPVIKSLRTTIISNSTSYFQILVGVDSNAIPGRYNCTLDIFSASASSGGTISKTGLFISIPFEVIN